VSGYSVHSLAAVQSEPNVRHIISSLKEGGGGDSVHLLPAVRSEQNVSHIISSLKEGGGGDSVQLLAAVRSELNVSHIISMRESVAIRFTYILYCKASRTSAISSQRGRRW
jgi:hypothetical protein